MLDQIFTIENYDVYNGQLSKQDSKHLEGMKPFIEDMNRPNDPIMYSWYEHCMWKWKKREYAYILNNIHTESSFGQKVLDAGCGYTPLIRYLASLGMDAYGFDWDAKEIHSNLKKSSTLLYGNAVNYEKQDLCKIEWPSDYFDYVACVSVLEHLQGGATIWQRLINKFFPAEKKPFQLKKVQLAINELLRCTKNGGSIIITMDCGWGGGIRPFLVEKLFGISLDDFPNLEQIRTFWKSDDYYSLKNVVYPRHPRDYTAFMITLRKNSHDNSSKKICQETT